MGRSSRARGSDRLRAHTWGVTTDDPLHGVLARIVGRTAQIVTALLDLADRDLAAPSELPGWSRLTIACHLRYGAGALSNMTDATLHGCPASYYPDGRAQQRPGTLRPDHGEPAHAVVHSLAAHSARLDQMWSAVGPEHWNHAVVEPSDNPDLGLIPLSRLPLLRLTEVEVHGSDLALGLGDWSTTFVDATFGCASMGSTSASRTAGGTRASTVPGCSLPQMARPIGSGWQTVSSNRSPPIRVPRRERFSRQRPETFSRCCSADRCATRHASPAISLSAKPSPWPSPGPEPGGTRALAHAEARP